MGERLTMRMVRARLAALGITIQRDGEWSEYVVRVRGSAPGEGYHTSDLADAWQTGCAMAAEAAARGEAPRDEFDRARREDEAMLGLAPGEVRA